MAETNKHSRPKWRRRAEDRPDEVLGCSTGTFYPTWAQFVGTTITTTHFMRIVRKIMLKGAGFSEIVPDITAPTSTVEIVTTLAMLRYRQTLD